MACICPKQWRKQSVV